MRRVSSSFTLALAAVAAPSAAAQQTRAPVAPQQIVAHTVDVSRRQASLGLELADGNEVRISLARGQLLINGSPAGTYTAGGALETSWRSLLDSAASMATPTLSARLSAWNLDLPDGDAPAKRVMDDALRGLPAVPFEGRASRAFRDDLAIEQAVEAATERAVESAVESAAGRIGRQDFDINVAPTSRGIGDVGNNVAGLIGMMVALSCIAFGLVSFAPRQLEAVTDTLQRSFVRSFFAGLFAQPLLLPVLGMLTVGLVLTIVGIIAVPVAIIAFVLAVALGFVGGYVALARAFGEILLKRRGQSDGFAAGTTPYKASVVGLAGLLAIWAPFALLSWLPVVGWILLWCAVVFTWIMATAGFGATILSRGGLRHAFVRPEIDTGSYSWTGEVAAARVAMKELE